MDDDCNNETNNFPHIEETKGRKKPKKKLFTRILSYALVGIICAVIGGVAAVGTILYVVPNTKVFKNSDLYKKLAYTSGSNNSTNVNYSNSVSNGQNLSVEAIAEKVGPAVVGVSTQYQVSYRSIFGTTRSTQQGMGSGVIFDSKGYIITNYHVIKDAISIKVILNNNQVVSAKEINHDEENDIAIIQITDKIDLPGIAELGDSDSVKVGELAVAIGNPMGELLGSVTTGIVSGVNRQIDEGGVKFIQTDAPISPGNSGGPLINSRGQVIGINSEKLVAEGAEGLGLAIPINLIKGKVDTLVSNPIKKNTAILPNSVMLGVRVQDIDEETAKEEDLVVGVLVSVVESGSVADKAGIVKGDIIVSFNGERVKTGNQLNSLKEKNKAGDTVKLIVNRDGKEKEVIVTFN